MTDATYFVSNSRNYYAWTDHGLSWQVGDTVEVEVFYRTGLPEVELPRQLLAGAVRDMEATSTVDGFLDVSWREPENADAAGVDSYVVYVRESNQDWSDARREVVPRSRGSVATAGGSQGTSRGSRTSRNEPRGSGEAEMIGSSDGWIGSPDGDRQSRSADGAPASSRQSDDGGDVEEGVLTFTLSIATFEGGQFEVYIYPRSGKLPGKFSRSDGVIVDPLGSLQSTSTVGRENPGQQSAPASAR